MRRVLACGLATVDVVQSVERVPGANEKVVALDTRVEAGGPALNAAVTATLLGMPAALVTAVGSSALAEVVRRDATAHGVDLVDTAGEGFAVPVSTVLVTAATGERAVISRNAEGSRSWAVPGDSALERLLDGVTAVLVDGHHLPVALAVAAAARRHGIPVIADGGSWKPGLDDLLRDVDVLVASADFSVPAAVSDPSVLGMEELLRLGPSWVARTGGREPVAWRAADGSSGAVPVPDVDVVDTLGAGDVLHGALLVDVGRRGTADLPGSLEVAVQVAARSVAAPGARGWAGRGP